MQDSKSLLPFPAQHIGSYVYCTQLTARQNCLNLTAALLYKNSQEGGGAFTVVSGNGNTGNEPTIVRTKVAGLVQISCGGISADGADLQFKICIRQPGDSSFRSVTDTFVPLKTATAVRGTCSITLPLPSGTEIVIDGTTIRTALDEGVDQMWLTVGYLAETNLRSQIRYGA